MGWREVCIDGVDLDGGTVDTFVSQFRAFCAFYGVEPDIDLSGSEGRTFLSVTFDGNSSFLDTCTPVLVAGAHEIARDTDAGGTVLRRIADEIDQQLTSQLGSSSTAVTIGRSGRELLQRIGGDGSFIEHGEDLRVHEMRLLEDLELLHSQAGPDAWRRRIDLHRRTRIDAAGIMLTALRLRRVAVDLAARLPEGHLNLALASFDARTEGLAALRNIGEHLDEYAIGRGRLDGPSVQPGDVFEWKVSREEVEVSARSHTVGVLSLVHAVTGLLRCLRAAADHHAFRATFLAFADLDFMEKQHDGRWEIVDRLEESEDQRAFRAAVGERRLQGQLPSAGCPECGNTL